LLGLEGLTEDLLMIYLLLLFSQSSNPMEMCLLLVTSTNIKVLARSPFNLKITCGLIFGDSMYRWRLGFFSFFHLFLKTKKYI
jgi:hypothetical protein